MSFSLVSPSNLPRLKLQRLLPAAVPPTRLDLSAAQECVIPPGQRRLVPTGWAMACPPGTYGRIAPRSGLALKHGIDVGAGVIDADYRGPVGVLLFNLSDQEFSIKVGDRIAQLILEQIVMAYVEECEDLDETVRGSGGFGSTGVEQQTIDEPDEKRLRTISPRPVDTTEEGSIAQQ
jgi:dUTP pyrophosphatase